MRRASSTESEELTAELHVLQQVEGFSKTVGGGYTEYPRAPLHVPTFGRQGTEPTA